MSDVIDLTNDEPDAKRQNVDLSKDINDLGLDLMQKVFDNLPLREQARAAMASKNMKGAYDVARGNLLADADGKLKHLVHYYQKRIARPHLKSGYLNHMHVMGFGGLSLRGRTYTRRHPVGQVVKAISNDPADFYQRKWVAARMAINKRLTDQIGRPIDIGRENYQDPRGFGP